MSASGGLHRAGNSPGLPDLMWEAILAMKGEIKRGREAWRGKDALTNSRLPHF